MRLAASLATVKALSDPSRLRLMNAMLDRPQCVEELSQRFGLAASTVCFHLKKLEAAGLVTKEREQYYQVYAVNRAALGARLVELVDLDDDGTMERQQDRLAKVRAKVLRTFFRDGRVERLPVQKKKRRIVLEEIASRLKNRRYRESELNELIMEIHPDYCTVRRELIEEGMMTRSNQEYWLISEPEGSHHTAAEKNRKSILKRAYKDNPPVAGIFRIVNRKNGKVLIGHGLDVRGILNSQRVQLKWRSHPNRALQADFNAQGSSFTFEVIDELEAQAESSPTELREELEALEALWLEREQPFDDRGYNRRPAKQR